MAAIFLNAAGHPINAKISSVTGLSSGVIVGWAQQHSSSRRSVLSDGLACIRSLVAAGSSRSVVETGGRHPTDLPEFRWMNILLGNMKISFSSTFHAFKLFKYAKRYLEGVCCLFHRSLDMATVTERIINALGVCMPCPERALRSAEFYASSSKGLPACGLLIAAWLREPVESGDDGLSD